MGSPVRQVAAEEQEEVEQQEPSFEFTNNQELEQEVSREIANQYI